MSTNYRIYLNYDNDKKVYCLPVNPEDLQITYKGQTTSADIDKFGEILHKGKRDAAIIKFESFFPPSWQSSFCSCSKGEFKTPATWHSWMQALEEAPKPCHFVVTNSPMRINLYADVTSYVAKEVGGDPGTIQFTVELREHREPKVGKWVNKITVSTPRKPKRVNNQAPSNKYRVNCSALHLRTGPNARIIGLMYRNTIVTSDGGKNGNWIHVNFNGKWGYAYQSYLTKC